MTSNLDSTDRELIDIIQARFPLEEEPFSALGRQLKVSGDEALRRIGRLKAGEIVRLIGPVFNAGKLGYRTTLVAMKIRADRVEPAARTISAHPHVSHCYERDHEFNFWFTLAMPAENDLDAEVQRLGKAVQARSALNLPAVRIFKIGAYFNISGSRQHAPEAKADYSGFFDKGPDLSHADRAVINALQQDLPLAARPFDDMSSSLSLETAEFLRLSRSLIERGIMRRYSASISHQNLGFVANAMACWKVPPGMAEATGKRMRTVPEISHCYERRTSPLWPYNLYAMMHAGTNEACRSIAARLTSELGPDGNGSVLLFSTREFRKTRVRYPV